MNTTYHVRYVLYHIAGDTWKQCQWLFLHLLYDLNINLLMEFPLMKDKEEKKKEKKKKHWTDWDRLILFAKKWQQQQQKSTYKQKQKDLSSVPWVSCLLN